MYYLSNSYTHSLPERKGKYIEIEHFVWLHSWYTRCSEEILCIFCSLEEKQMSTKGAVMMFIVKNPISRIEIYTYFISLFQQQRNPIWRADKTTVLPCICWNFMLAVLKQACDNCFISASGSLWENPEYIHSLHGCCKNPCIRRGETNKQIQRFT